MSLAFRLPARPAAAVVLLCAWINGLTDPAAFHPNADGYAAYTGAVTAAVRPSSFR
jgi:hypothetical protein